jgi:hypothetical protein
VLHSAAHAINLDCGEFLIGIRPDKLRKEPERLAHRLFEGDHSVITVTGEHPGFQWYALERIEMARRKLGDPDVIQPGGDGHRFAPVSKPAAAAQVAFFHEGSIGYRLIVCRRVDQELTRGLVIRMPRS